MTRRSEGLLAPSRAAFATMTLLAAFFVGSSCRTVGPRLHAPERTGYDLASLVPQPSIRVGVLLDGKRAALSADSGVTVWLITPNDDRVVERRVKRATFGAASVVAPRSAKGVRLLETGDVALRAGIVPIRNAEALDLDGTRYRGAFEVRPAGGGVNVVNVLGVEDYLRGVVPNELSPHTYGELEALKAQAVAARTYAIRNMGRFSAQGYDICATPTCQVYKGRDTEAALSDRAIAETKGVIATSGGDPINAVYTSTCGGHTEDGENVFEGVAVPYLRGVVCHAERGRTGAGVIQGRAAVAGVGDPLVDRDVAMLEALGVLPKGRSGSGDAAPAPSAREIEDWTNRALDVAGAKRCDEDEELSSRRASVFRYVASRACLADREQVASTGPQERLVKAQDTMDHAMLVRPDDDITPAEVAGLLASVVHKLGSPNLVQAEFTTTASGRLSLRRDGRDEERFAVAKGLPIFKRMGGELIAVSRVALMPGDAVTAVVSGDQVRFLEVDQSPQVAADGTPKHYGWEVRLTGDQLAKAVAGAGHVGRVTRVEPKRLGVSGRVVSLLVAGDAGEVTLNGLRIRTTLGLKENLFVLQEERTAGGDPAWVFTGNGWGHGVGLCQVGAYGLARGGARFEKILKHYYTGVSLTRAY